MARLGVKEVIESPCSCILHSVCNMHIWYISGWRHCVPLNAMFNMRTEYELNDSGAETIVVLDSLYPRLER